MPRYSFNKLSKPARDFFNLVNAHYKEYLIMEKGEYIITRDILRSICNDMNGQAEYIESPELRKTFETFTFDYVVDTFKLNNSIFNSTFNGSGNRGEYYLPIQMSNFKIVSTDDGEEQIQVENTDDMDSDIRTDEEIELDQIERFYAIESGIHDVILGIDNGMFVYGPGGFGKTVGIESRIISAGLEFNRQYIKVSGSISGPGLYALMYRFKNRGQIIIIDDANKIFYDVEGRNYIMAGLDDKPIRRVSRMKVTQLKSMDEEGEEIPNMFEYEGSIVVISNLTLEMLLSKDNSVATDFGAIASRIPTINIKIKTTRERLIRIRYMIRHGLFSDMELTNQQQEEIIEFLYDNRMHIPRLCLRKARSVAKRRKYNPETWQNISKIHLEV